MKIFALVLSILALVSSAVALKNVVCGLEHAKDGENGIKCRASFESWSYKADENKCIDFIYGGCFGNDNRFLSLEECEELCKE